jgi:hypothetical protein
MNVLGLDLGYNGIKILWMGQYYKIATTINYYNDSGIDFGEVEVYEFEGNKYNVGIVAEDSFTTTNFDFLYNFSPLMIYHILKKLNITEPVLIKTGLALVDWGDQEKRDKFKERISTITVNGETITNQVELVGPQGDGSFRSFIVDNGLSNDIPKKVSIIDIGYKTINFLHYEDGRPIPQKSKGFPDHGVVTIIKPFTAFLENTYKMAFSEQEAIDIFLTKEFIYNGEEQPKVVEKIAEAKQQFVRKLMNSILVSENKTLKLSNIVYISGGGSYMLKDIDLPPNVKIGKEFNEFENVKGYTL